eukprot:scaffold71032_cov36-Tisochrysis_lutea.AAC.2
MPRRALSTGLIEAKRRTTAAQSRPRAGPEMLVPPRCPVCAIRARPFVSCLRTSSEQSPRAESEHPKPVQSCQMVGMGCQIELAHAPRIAPADVPRGTDTPTVVHASGWLPSLTAK